MIAGLFGTIDERSIFEYDLRRPQPNLHRPNSQAPNYSSSNPNQTIQAQPTKDLFFVWDNQSLVLHIIYSLDSAVRFFEVILA